MAQRQTTVKKVSPGAQKSLRNTYSRSKDVFSTIQNCLATHGVRDMQYTFADDNSGRYVALNFTLVLEGQRLTFRMPARIPAVERILFDQKTPTPLQRDKAYQTAWANIRDWLISQFALIDTGMVEPEEVFLPYLLVEEGQTLYERLRARRFLLSAEADAEREPGSRVSILPN